MNLTPERFKQVYSYDPRAAAGLKPLKESRFVYEADDENDGGFDMGGGDDDSQTQGAPPPAAGTPAPPAGGAPPAPGGDPTSPTGPTAGAAPAPAPATPPQGPIPGEPAGLAAGEQGDPATADAGGADQEIDVTDFVEKSTDVVSKVDNQTQSLDKILKDLDAKLQSVDSVVNRMSAIAQEIEAMKPKTPIEQLELRSLDSYPFTEKPADYFASKGVNIAAQHQNNQLTNQPALELTAGDVDNFSTTDIRSSFNPDEDQEESTVFQKVATVAPPRRQPMQEAFVRKVLSKRKLKG